MPRVEWAGCDALVYTAILTSESTLIESGPGLIEFASWAQSGLRNRSKDFNEKCDVDKGTDAEIWSRMSERFVLNFLLMVWKWLSSWD